MDEDILNGVKTDLLIVLDEILTRGRPAPQSLDQLTYDHDQLFKLLGVTKDINLSHDISNTLQTINRVLNIFNSEKEELIKTVKPFSKYSGHVTLSGGLIGKEVVIVKL
jgi:hypothetical protein